MSEAKKYMAQADDAFRKAKSAWAAKNYSANEAWLALGFDYEKKAAEAPGW